MATDRFDVIKFEDLTGPKGEAWVRIGGGSFGVVFKGEYLGTVVAIKEVLANNTYDVEKYFERECVLMKEARHPNIVQYIGLSKSPDGRIYIVSEFVGPNLRLYIADQGKPFDWPLRISFATDIARAVAYLHARNCMHRDLKGENLLITGNNRIKVCDFGFARIAARNEDEMRRMSYCGTDGYMSPEILLGIDFSLPSDVFSLGIIFCEIISRHLVDPTTFKRQMPSFGLDEDEVRDMANDGCPADFIQLCLDMTKFEPELRPDMRQIVVRLRAIEQEVVQREFSKGTLTNIGSLRGASLAAVIGSKSKKGKRADSRRLPSFEGLVSISRRQAVPTAIREESPDRNAEGSSDTSSEDEEEVERCLRALEGMNIDHSQQETLQVASTFKVQGHGNPWWDDTSTIPAPPSIWLNESPTALPQTKDTMMRNSTSIAQVGQGSVMMQDGDRPSTIKQYSTSVMRPTSQVTHPSLATSLSRMTGAQAMNATLNGNSSKTTLRKRSPLEAVSANQSPMEANEDLVISPSMRREVSYAETLKGALAKQTDKPCGDETTQSFMTARSDNEKAVDQYETHDRHEAHEHVHEPSFAMATIASTFFDASLLYHRFSLIKNGTRRPSQDYSDLIQQTAAAANGAKISPTAPNAPPNSPSSRISYQLILANALTKCNVCSKRLGFGSYMDCDDCPYKTHVACAEMAEPNCQELELPGDVSGASASSPTKTSSSVDQGPNRSPPKRRSSGDDAAKRHGRRSSGSPTISEDAEVSASAVANRAIKSSSKKEKDLGQTPPSSLSKGVALFRKRNSKSPPPTPKSPTNVRA